MPPLVLFVCRANVCRSPTAVAAFQRYLTDRDRDGFVTLRSAGLQASPGESWCDLAQQALGAKTIKGLDFENMISSQLRTRALAPAALILASDAETSAGALKMSPRVRSRLFTMVEAALLARLVLDRVDGMSNTPPTMTGELAVARPKTKDLTLLLKWLVGEMNAARGQLPRIQPRPRRWWTSGRTRETPLWDVPDAHTGADTQSHEATMAPLLDSVESLAASIVSLLPPTDLENAATPPALEPPAP